MFKLKTMGIINEFEFRERIIFCKYLSKGLLFFDK